MADDPAARQLLANILEDLLRCASRSADPDQSINYLERFARAALNRTRLFTYLAESPQTLEILATVLGGSPYMAEILIRDPQHFYWVTDPNVLRRSSTKRNMRRELLQTLKALADQKRQLDYLRFFKRREMLHIGSATCCGCARSKKLFRRCPSWRKL
jgi:glutamate-ammonia-ligase adenylyltransferase